MSVLGKLLGFHGAVFGRRRRAPLRLPEANGRLGVQFMHRPTLDSDYMNDLRVSARDRRGRSPRGGR